MPTSVPTTAEINAQNVANLERSVGQVIPINEKAFLRVLASVEAGLTTGHYKYALSQVMQSLALTATGDDLDRIGSNYQVERIAAVAFVGDIDQPAVNGTTIPITVDYTADASGIRYTVNAAAVAAGGTATVEVTATEPGVNGTLSASDTLTIGTQIAGITSTTATFNAVITTGIDRETDTAYRRRVLQEIRTVGGGGNAVDQKTWAEAVAGVARVFPFSGAPSAASHKVKDPDMEAAGITYWTAEANTTLTKQGGAYEGSQCLRVAVNGAGGAASQVCLEIGRDYTISGWYRGDGGAAQPQIRDGAAAILVTGLANNTWQSFSVSFTATTNEVWLYGVIAGVQYVEFDAISLIPDDSLPGDRVIYVESTTAIDADGIPPQSLLDDVETALLTDPDTLADRQVLGTTEEKLFVEPIVRTSFDVEITSLVVDATQETACKASLDTGVDEYFRATGPYVEGVDAAIDRNDAITSVSLSEIVQGILAAYSATVSSLTFEVTGGAPTTRYDLGESETAKLGAITYV